MSWGSSPRDMRASTVARMLFQAAAAVSGGRLYGSSAELLRLCVLREEEKRAPSREGPSAHWRRRLMAVRTLRDYLYLQESQGRLHVRTKPVGREAFRAGEPGLAALTDGVVGMGTGCALGRGVDDGASARLGVATLPETTGSGRVEALGATPSLAGSMSSSGMGEGELTCFGLIC